MAWQILIMRLPIRGLLLKPVLSLGVKSFCNAETEDSFGFFIYHAMLTGSVSFFGGHASVPRKWPVMSSLLDEGF